MRYIVRFIPLITICFTLASCSFRKDKCPLLKGETSLDSNILCSCNQFFITDSGVCLLYYDYASPSAYNPFHMNPYILYYDKALTLQSSKRINALKIHSVHLDTIIVCERDSYPMRYKTKHPKLLDKSIKYVSMPSRIDKIYNKAIESFQLDTLTMNVIVGYKEYDDCIIGVRNKSFYQDSTITYVKQSAVFKLSDFIFHPNYPASNKICETRYLHFTQDRTIDERLVFENQEILEKFYSDLYVFLLSIYAQNETKAKMKITVMR